MISIFLKHPLFYFISSKRIIEYRGLSYKNILYADDFFVIFLFWVFWSGNFVFLLTKWRIFFNIIKMYSFSILDSNITPVTLSLPCHLLSNKWAQNLQISTIGVFKWYNGSLNWSWENFDKMMTCECFQNT